MTDPLHKLALRARGEAFFLASVLEAYALAEQLDDPGLATALGCPPEDLLMIRLCRAPRRDSAGFRADISDICDRFALEFECLANIVKQGQVYARLRCPAPAEGGFLMAARDRDKEPNEPPGEAPP